MSTLTSVLLIVGLNPVSHRKKTHKRSRKPQDLDTSKRNTLLQAQANSDEILKRRLGLNSAEAG
jgi:hypothetical protein